MKIVFDVKRVSKGGRREVLERQTGSFLLEKGVTLRTGIR